MFDTDYLTAKISNAIKQGAADRMNDKDFLQREITAWRNSPRRLAQIKGHLYYDGEHDIINRRRTAIGDNGELTEVENLPNNRIIDNQYGKMVNQKANYLLGQPFVIETDNDAYANLLKDIFDKGFMKTLKNAGKVALNGGISWLYPYCDDSGELCFRLFPAYEILPFWRDSEHTRLDMAVRLYQVEDYEGQTHRLIDKVEVFDLQGVHRYILQNGNLAPDYDNEGACDYCYVFAADKNGVKSFNWTKIPLIPVKYNENETPLLNRVKTLQDGINIMLSDFENCMQEDTRNTILVLKNYDGENLGEFRRNLATYGAVKVRCDGDSNGGVETLEVNVNTDNYKAIVEIFKKALIENAMGYDAKDDRLNGNPNQMNIQSMYSDIDLDANDMETELQAAFEEILWFINAYLANTGQGDFDGEQVTVTFNRDILINESEAIANCAASVGILSEETIVAQHPWVDDPQEELKRLETENRDIKREYDPFEQKPVNGEEDEKQ